VAQDLNGDGMPEIVTADRGTMRDPREEKPANDELSLLIAERELTYERQTARSGFAPYCIEVANIDARKAPDLVVGSFHAARGRDLTLFRNLNDNLFEPVYFNVPDDFLGYERMNDGDNQAIFTKPGITSVAVQDFDHDGFRDVIATGWASDVLVLFPGHATEYFSDPRFIRAPGGPRDIALGDFDKDGETDLVTTLYSADQVALWKGDGTGDFKEVERFASRGSLPHKVRVRDMNGDGTADLVVSHCYASDSIGVFYGQDGFRFAVSQEIVLTDMEDLAQSRAILEHEIRDIRVGDYDRNGRQDIAAACFASGQVVVLMNVSEDDEVPQTFRQETYTYDSGKPRALCQGDFNSDGRPDLAVAVWGRDTNAVVLLLGK
jgi:hypothetical protein